MLIINYYTTGPLKAWKITKTHNDTDQKINTVKKRIKSTDLVHAFATKLRFIIYGKNISQSLHHRHTYSLHAPYHKH